MKPCIFLLEKKNNVSCTSAHLIRSIKNNSIIKKNALRKTTPLIIKLTQPADPVLWREEDGAELEHQLLQKPRLRVVLTQSADPITGREEDGAELEHQLAQKPRLRVVEDVHATEGFQVHVNGDLCLQLFCRGKKWKKLKIEIYCCMKILCTRKKCERY